MGAALDWARKLARQADEKKHGESWGLDGGFVVWLSKKQTDVLVKLLKEDGLAYEDNNVGFGLFPVEKYRKMEDGELWASLNWERSASGSCRLFYRWKRKGPAKKSKATRTA